MYELIGRLNPCPPLSDAECEDRLTLVRSKFPGLSDLEALDAQACEEDFHYFVTQAWRHCESEQFIDGEHLVQLCLHLQAWKHGHIQNLAANIPPQHCKSTLFSCMFPAWDWADSPTERYLSFSYSKEYALRDNWRARKLMSTEWYQRRWGCRWQFTKDQNVKSRYANRSGGQRVANAMGSAIGEGGTRIVIDDPQSLDQALNPEAREKVIRFYNGALGLRNFGNRTRRALIMQRLHNGDLTAYLQKQVQEGLEDWVFLIFPIVFVSARACYTRQHVDTGKVLNHTNVPPEEADKYVPFGGDWREKDGDPIWPELYGGTKDNDANARLALARLEAKTPDDIWASQGLQNPVPPGGSTFRELSWFPTYEELPDEARYGKPIIFSTWDCGQKDNLKKKNDPTSGFKNDPTAGFLIAYYPHIGLGHYYVLHRSYFWGKYDSQEDEMKHVVRGLPDAWAHVVEGGGNGSALVSAGNRWIRSVQLEAGFDPGLDPEEQRYKFHEWLPGGMSKPYRASIVSPHFRQRRVHFPAWAVGDWYEHLTREFLDFPYAEHDDQVDAIDMGILWMEQVGWQIFLQYFEGRFQIGRPSVNDIAPPAAPRGADEYGLHLARDLGRLWTPGLRG